MERAPSLSSITHRRSNSLNAARGHRPRPHSWANPPSSPSPLAPPIVETLPPRSSPRPSTASTSTGSLSEERTPEPEVLESDSTALFKLVDIPRKGKGLVAARFISSGSIIFSEAPLFVQPISPSPSNSAILSLLAFKTRDEQTEFFKLTRSADRKSLPALGIFEANSLPCSPSGEVTKDGKEQQHGLFLLASRVNHSCSPNVVRAWDGTTQCMVLRAIRSIAAGEELCVGYGALLGTREERQAWLSERWGFTCACDVCELQGEAPVEESDRRRESIARLYEEVSQCLKEPTLGIRKVKIALRLLKEENLVHCEASFCFDAFQFCVLVSDFVNAKIWARRAWEASCNTFGPDSAAAHTFKMYWANPRAHRLAGMMPKLTLSGPD